MTPIEVALEMAKAGILPRIIEFPEDPEVWVFEMAHKIESKPGYMEHLARYDERVRAAIADTPSRTETPA